MRMKAFWKARLIYLVAILAIPSFTAGLVWNIVRDSNFPSSAPWWSAFIFVFMFGATGATGAILYGRALFDTQAAKR